MTPSTSAPLLGAVLGNRYELVRHIARGGMSDVYEGWDRLLQRAAAVKVYRGSAPTDRDRFDSEVVVLASLSHPGLVQVFDAGEHGDDGFVVLELVDGPTLGTVLAERGALPAVEVARLGSVVADALAFVHAAGIVHRDVTPSNVLCGRDGRPRLADFGIARLIDTARVTVTATAIGTAAYMAPEQVEGRDVTWAADVYALGLVLLEALTGRAEFTGPSHEVAIARLGRDPEIGPEVPAAWHELLREMTSRQPTSRPPAAVVGDRLAELAKTAGTAPLVVPGASGAAGEVDGHAATEVVPVAGGTTIMPAILQPEPEQDLYVAPPAALGLRSRPALWLALAVVAVVVAVLAASGGGDLEVPTDTTEPVVGTVPPTTSTVPPTTTEEPQGNGKGKGNGNGREKDDD